MQLEAKKYIYDIRHACQLILEFIEGKQKKDYLSDALLQSATERQLEVIGEAINQLAKLDPTVADRITNYKRLIGLRNILIHGYADIDDELIWDLLQTNLATLVKEIDALETD